MTRWTRPVAALAAWPLALMLTSCAGPGAPTTGPLACDMNGLGQLRIDAQTRVIAVHAFKAGDEVRLPNSPAPHLRAGADLCLVKLVVGPGNPGPAGAPSTSPGIGIEVWLPARGRWNQVIRAYGSGGWAGGFHTDPTRIGQTGAANDMHLAAVAKGYAVSGSDHGHGGTVSGRNASFGLLPDGSINTVLWRDFAERSLQEQALKTRAVVAAYYGRPHARAYFDGFSTGGRQGYKLAQRFPQLYDGILAGAPAFNWTRFITAELYPQVVMQRDLGRTIPNAKLHAASARALRACGGDLSRWGFLLDPLACAYDPAQDPAALCTNEKTASGAAGTDREPTCLSQREAQALSKIWYGMTRDGQAPAPREDNGGTGSLALSRGQLWWGLTRGTDLTALAGDKAPFPIASQVVAISMLNPRLAQKGMLTNATGQAEDGWRALGYADLVTAYERGLAQQAQLADINTDSPDLTAFRDRGGKVLSYHGLSDQLIMPQGSLNYIDRLAQRMGGMDRVREFNRLFFIAGMGHSGSFNLTASIGLDGKPTAAGQVPLPQSSVGRDELFEALRAWVEKGVAPQRIDLVAASGALSLPTCAYPQRPQRTGASADSAQSYVCR